jgi:hypothetical protein
MRMGEGMLYELRQYRMKPGQKDNWVKFMEEVIIPFQTDKGMTILGSWTGEQADDDDLFVWIRRFDDEDDRKRLYAAVYETEQWKTQIGPRASEMLDGSRTVVTRLNPTPRSAMV